MSTAIQTLEYLLVRVCRAHYALAGRKFEKLGLFRGQPPVLFQLERRDGQTHGQLARELAVTPATITTMLQRMEQAGFVTRCRDSHDERVSHAYLTDAGRALLAEARRITEQMDEICFANFSDEEKQQARLLLERILANLGDAPVEREESRA